MDYRKRLMILQRASESTGRRWSMLERDEEPEMISIRDITQQKDDSDTEDYVSQVLMGALLENFLFKLLIIVMIVSNCIIMAFQTDAIIAKKYDIAFSICEHIILTVFIWEILVKWYYGFNIFWKVTSGQDLTQPITYCGLLRDHCGVILLSLSLSVSFLVFQNGWNVLDCLVTLALMLGPLIFPQGGDSLLKVIR
nr:cation channel sperm-associated protein 4-like [Oncorhynchus nerka]